MLDHGIKRTKIKELLLTGEVNREVVAKGWVRTKRESKNVTFITLNDGSTIQNLQVVVQPDTLDLKILERINTGAGLSVKGVLIESPGAGQRMELLAKDIILYGEANPDEFPLQPKRHSLEFLREKAHLRFRRRVINFNC